MAHSAFSIKVRFLGGLSPAQELVFEEAASRWSQIIIGDLPSVRVNGEVIDDVLISAQGVLIDGEGGVLGRAGPRQVRFGSLLPATGIMQFDTEDLARLEGDGSLQNVIVHEMGHVLGLGTMWQDMGLLSGAGTINPVFTGPNATKEYNALLSCKSDATSVPVANTGGPGTRDGHWRESVFADELMTGFLNTGSNPLSRVTVGALDDMGYEVNFDAADCYHLPSATEVAMLGIAARDGHDRQCCACGRGCRAPKPVVLPKEATLTS